MISEFYERTWSTGPDEPRVQAEIEYRRRADDRVADVPKPVRTRRPIRTILDTCIRIARALPWAA